jgi:hypothetical protein
LDPKRMLTSVPVMMTVMLLILVSVMLVIVHVLVLLALVLRPTAKPWMVPGLRW